LSQAGKSARRKDRDLVAALERELATAFPPADARREARRLVTALRSVTSSARHSRESIIVQHAVCRWRQRGLDADAAARAVLPLLEPAASTPPRPSRSRDDVAAMRSLLDGLPVPILVVNSRLRVLVCNQAFEDLAPGAFGSARGRRLKDILDPVAHAEFLERLESAHVQEDELQLMQLALTALPGAEFLASWIRYAPPGRPRGWLVRLASGPATTLEAMGERLRQATTQKEKFAALLTVSNAVVNSLELDRTLDTIAHEARAVMQVDECTVFLLDEGQGVLVPAACDVQSFRDEVMAIRLPLGQGVTGHVALTGKGQIVNDALNDPRAVQVPGTPVEQSSLLCVPLRVREKVAGAITLTRVGERTFHDEDLELATLFAGQCSAAISNARLYEETRRAYDELREAQSQLVQSAKLNALGEMAGGVAHDFNNILAAILGRTQLLLRDPLDDALRRQLEVIEQAALDGAQAVRRVQEFTRLRQDERFEACELDDVLRGVLELTRPAWEAESKRRGITLSATLDLRAARSVSGNASELREVFTNLVLNAIDAMPWGGTLTLASEDVGEEVCVRVTDTGIGMDAETCRRVFDPFFTTKNAKGTGLGLSIAYGIVTRHHGRIEVTSDPGCGSRFSVWLPVVHGRRAVGQSAAEWPLPRLRVLVVDDEEAVLNVLHDQLQLLGQDVEAALGGPAGLQRFDPERYDAVFTDLGMPAVNGWELAQAIKSRSPAMPVVIVTGWGTQLESRALRARGVDFVVPKPFALEDVRAVLQQIIARPARAA
jgi:signal transduction histidine kinase/ActR/RegA family two-component response regulator/PAS domain-containing protein